MDLIDFFKDINSNKFYLFKSCINIGSSGEFSEIKSDFNRKTISNLSQQKYIFSIIEPDIIRKEKRK